MMIMMMNLDRNYFAKLFIDNYGNLLGDSVINLGSWKKQFLWIYTMKVYGLYHKNKQDSIDIEWIYILLDKCNIAIDEVIPQDRDPSPISNNK